MSGLLLAVALFASAGTPAADAAAPENTAPEIAQGLTYPPGAPRDDYGLVSWCYGALDGYLALHDKVMPEVKRIETTYRRPGSKLEDDLRVYDDQMAQGRQDLAAFTRAIDAAEKASPRPIAEIGARAKAKGRNTWAGADQLPPARVAQEWMSWTLPAACQTAAAGLEKRAALEGAAFNIEEAPAADAAP